MSFESKDGLCAAVNCCKDGWFAYNGHCYYIDLDIKLSFSAARLYCRRFGADLVQLETFAENTFLKGFLKKFKAQHTWMGLNDMSHEGIWRWTSTNKHATFSDWSPRQPDNHKNNEDCVHFSYTAAYQWNDFPCSHSINFLCEKASA
ncbi:perlucin-like protein [Ruditapes philippinarum]|uniref:perlucin-like protein n=1 Tax=Ruditapes philippinarum TaxID=129788 RepID=UPI00295BCBC6|nr:perlucin-like protein [Ruditapes philippinarum]